MNNEVSFLQIFGLGLIYLGFVIFALILVAVFFEWYLWRKEQKRQKEKSKQPIRIPFDKKI